MRDGHRGLGDRPPEQGLQAIPELTGLEAAQVVAVHPAELLLVEDGRGLRHPLEREPFDELLRGEELRALVVAPAEQRNVVAHGLREVARLTELLHRRRSVPLRALLAVRPVQQREVRVDRRLRTQGAQDQQLARGVGEMVRAAHHVRDRHVPVVHRDREVVERAAVRARDHEVVDGRVLEHDLAADHVLHSCGALVRNP